MKPRIVRFDDEPALITDDKINYAKVVEGLQRALNVQRLIHNWVRPHWGLQKNRIPAMAMGYLERPVTMLELLSSRGFKDITP
ncbi:MAG: hypothetical protein KME35_06785 [Aphanocapsa sp. GSE-SYN-MK-11-07L]|jgi:hypothetical protein|nr:hypothetical protein [Aphanocapsa sp. GSE-SYN-MK-11-07L]